MRLQGRTAIVTGAATGIGRAIAERLLAEGASVVAADIDETRGAETASALSAGGDIRFHKADVGRRAEVEALLQAALDAHGSVDILVNNAGIVHGAEFLDLAEEDFDRVLRVNLKGAFLCGQAAARQMVSQSPRARGERGVIINMSSVNAVLAIPNQVPYVVSKGALNQLTKVMALGLAAQGVRVVGIGPGSIATELLKTAVLGNEAARARIMSRTPLGRLGEPEEVARVALFLASDDASYLSGTTIYPDGGRLALNYTV